METSTPDAESIKVVTYVPFGFIFWMLRELLFNAPLQLAIMLKHVAV
jgi:hypothetical protein